ncbi:MAG: hypothetical protein P1P82_06000 [Bacteroidales bacterium]|nr:hypothetical protein [Bacteroidales bacterium]MDT8432475.1 hypothetical protein [Bacteroidales bacterium]
MNSAFLAVEKPDKKSLQVPFACLKVWQADLMQPLGCPGKANEVRTPYNSGRRAWPIKN